MDFFNSTFFPREKLIFYLKRHERLFWTMFGHQNHSVFSHDVTAAIWGSQNNETAAMLVPQTSPVGVELFSYARAFFCSN